MAHRIGIYLAYDRRTFNTDDQEVLQSISPYIDGVKFGYQSIYAEVLPSHRTVMSLGREFCNDILEKEVFIDAKLDDTANTVEQALNLLGTYGCDKVTLHAPQSSNSLKLAVRLGKQYSFKPVAVTVLTDIDKDECVSLFKDEPPEAVARFASHAHQHGVRDFVCSVHEVEVIRKATGQEVTITTPAIRPLWSANPDEQKRVATPTRAMQAGADFIVVGRPILRPPQGMTSRESARLIRQELDGTLPSGNIVDKLA